MYIDLDEQTLARLCSKGDVNANGELYRRYAARLYALCRRYTGNPDDAKDLMQDTFIKAFEKIRAFRYKGSGTLYGWISRIAINMAINHIRRNKWRTVSIDDNNEDIPDPPPEKVMNISSEKLLEMISQLPEIRRAIFNLYCIDGFKHKEISKILGISEKGSSSILAKARGQLKRAIIGYLKENESL